MPIPYRAKVSFVFGDPIQFEQCDDPTLEQVEAGVDQFCDALTRLFDQYKAQAGFPDSQLVIMHD